MTTGEWFAGASLLGGACAWVLLEVRKFVAAREDKLGSLIASVTDIRRALLGDGYGHAGLVAEFAAMKASQARTEQRVDEIEHRLEQMERAA
jgi:cytochrome bd-type quinol oxidase subunit 1